MEAPKLTASSIINFTEKLEDDSAAFYENLARRYAENEGTFLSFSEESRKNKVLVIRTYRETITDALEACFCFETLNLNDYKIKAELAEDASLSDALKVAIRLEENASKFYSDVADQCKYLLATIPRAFQRVSEKRKARKQRLESLLH
jgi:hypothetical protein